MPRLKKTLSRFIADAEQKHGDIYDYSLVEYKNNYTKIKIICCIHGIFEQTPNNHLKGKRCGKCYGNIKKTTVQYINEVAIIHDDIYDYTITDYTGDRKYIKYLCPNHGIITQLASNHLKYGCHKCFGKSKKTTKSFINESNIVHKNIFDYSKTVYTGSHDKVIIICQKHGEFEQAPTSHISGHGCERCGFEANTKTSVGETLWLDELNISKENRQQSIKIPGRKRSFTVDGFDPSTNTIYEYYGDFWHGNPEKYNPNDINPMTKTTFGELYENTMNREKILKEHGYKIISEWG